MQDRYATRRGDAAIPGVHDTPVAGIAALTAAGELVAPRTGEHRLMFAVLCDAVHVLAGGQARRSTPRQRAELRAWFDSRDGSYVFSFESVCDALGLDAGYVRRCLFGPHATVSSLPSVHRVHPPRLLAPHEGRRAAEPRQRSAREQ
jgi:hypothetical protein